MPTPEHAHTHRRIGLFGGSFNPIHNGHIAIGRTMLTAMSLDEVWYMVSPHNPLKKADGLIDEAVRLELTRVALQDDAGLIASDYEFHLPRPSYTWNTLQSLKADYPGDEFVLIIGGDNLRDFKKWAHYEEILRDYDIVVFPRTGEDGNCMAPDSLDLARVHIVNVPTVDVTSTMLRQMLHNGQDISPFVPQKVLAEIQRLHLWQ